MTDYAAADLVNSRLPETLRTRASDRVLEVRPLSYAFRGFVSCGGYVCPDSAQVQVNGVPLCSDHATERVARRLWDLKIWALMDMVKAHGFDVIEDVV